MSDRENFFLYFARHCPAERYFFFNFARYCPTERSFLLDIVRQRVILYLIFARHVQQGDTLLDIVRQRVLCWVYVCVCIINRCPRPQCCLLPLLRLPCTCVMGSEIFYSKYYLLYQRLVYHCWLSMLDTWYVASHVFSGLPCFDISHISYK